MKKIILFLVPVFIIIAALGWKENITITGNVKDEVGRPVKATVKAGNVISVADANGNYKITVSETQQYLEFIAPGYISNKIKINKQKVINVILKSHAAALKNSSQQDVVVVAKGVQNKEETGNVSQSISGKINGIVSRSYPLNKIKISYPNGYITEEEFNTEEYSNIVENGFHKVADEPLSTFSIDVDAASYSNVRRFLNEGQLPPAGAVRIEEMVNYFHYEYPQPTGKDPFSINTEISSAPWNKDHKLVLIGLQGEKISTDKNFLVRSIVF